MGGVRFMGKISINTQRQAIKHGRGKQPFVLSKILFQPCYAGVSRHPMTYRYHHQSSYSLRHLSKRPIQKSLKPGSSIAGVSQQASHDGVWRGKVNRAYPGLLGT